MTFSGIVRMALAAVAIVAAGAAAARTYTFKGGPSPFPITIPDSWTVSPVKNGVEIRRPDDEVLMWIQAATQASINPLMDEYKAYFGGQGVTFTGAPKTQEHQLGPATVLDMELPATWKGAPTVVRIAVVTRPSGPLLVGYWASPRGDRDSDADVNRILADLIAAP